MILSLIAVLHFEAEFECRSVFPIREDSNVASKVLTDDLAECESESHAMWIEPTVVRKLGEWEPYLLLVFECDSRSFILDDD